MNGNGTPEQSAGGQRVLTRSALTNRHRRKPPLCEQSIREWLVSSGFAELNNGQAKPTGLGLEAAAALDPLGGLGRHGLERRTATRLLDRRDHGGDGFPRTNTSLLAASRPPGRLRHGPRGRVRSVS